MKTSPKITKVTVTTFEHELENVGKDYNTFNMVYEAGSRLKQRVRFFRFTPTRELLVSTRVSVQMSKQQRST